MPQGVDSEGLQMIILQSIISGYNDKSVMIHIVSIYIFIYIDKVYKVLDFLSSMSLGKSKVRFM